MQSRTNLLRSNEHHRGAHQYGEDRRILSTYDALKCLIVDGRVGSVRIVGNGDSGECSDMYAIDLRKCGDDQSGLVHPLFVAVHRSSRHICEMLAFLLNGGGYRPVTGSECASSSRCVLSICSTPPNSTRMSYPGRHESEAAASVLVGVFISGEG